MRRILSIVFSAALLLLGAVPANAGGSWLEPGWERVEAGDHIKLSGNVVRGQLGWTDDGPFFTYLSGEGYGTTVVQGNGGAVTDVPLGELTIAPGYTNAQASIDIALPDDTPPGEYRVVVCNEPCTTGFGDLIGAVLYVGIDPPRLPEDDLSVVTVRANLSTSTTTDVVTATIVETTTSASVATAAAHLMLAPHPARSSNLAPAWIAVSAGLAAVVLLLILFTRQSDSQ